jgi:hypothetical protein
MYADDVEAARAFLRDVRLPAVDHDEFTSGMNDRWWGRLAMRAVPGGGQLATYQPITPPGGGDG